MYDIYHIYVHVYDIYLYVYITLNHDAMVA